jgi:integrase
MKTKAATPVPLWENTSVQCLLRNTHSRKYYGRFTLHGKQKWVSLDTDVLSVAKLRLSDEAAKIEKQRGTTSHVAAGRATMGELMDVYLARTQANPDFKPSTIVSRETALKKLKKTWPGVESLEPKRVTPAAILEWTTRFKVEGTNFVPPGAKKALKGNSATSVNRAVDTLRRVLDIAIEQGQIHSNPVLVRPPTGRLKKKVIQKKLVLPSMNAVEKMLTTMEKTGEHGGWGIEAAYLCRFLMMSGARIGEVPLTTWECVYWEKNQLHLPGYKTETSDRHIPLFKELGVLLKKIIERRKATTRSRADKKKKTFLEPDDAIFRIRECQKTIDAACQKSGVKRVTHHDFRHLFATICIEAGVDIPTVAAWLGHSDGGVLAMKTYGHLRIEHSQQSAEKVNFGKKK